MFALELLGNLSDNQGMANGKTIQVYLPAGDPKGIRIADITSRLGRVVLFPRALFSEAFVGEESGKPGVYFLFGLNEENGDRPRVYIGEAEDGLSRIRQHLQGKGFWTEAALFVYKAKGLNKAKIKFFERFC